MSVPAFRLRDFDEADLPALLDLWVAAWREVGLAIDFEARRPWAETRVRNTRSSGGAVVVGVGADGRPAGFVTIDVKSGELDQLCVAPAERGSGLASALMREAKRLSPGRVELDVNENNPRAIRFYEREEFIVVARGVNQASGLPTLRMRWASKSRR